MVCFQTRRKQMNKFLNILFLLCFLALSGYSQKDQESSDTFFVKGQLSAVTHYNPSNNLPLWFGGRYIPQVNYNLEFGSSNLIDFEASANMYGNVGTEPFNEAEWSGKIKPYRAWVRYSNQQFELRAGLQKINFGSANMLRPLMWFDQIDPRDPLRLTDGVWGILGRYYFLNNTNIWLWALYGNNNPRGWENTATSKNTPEFGGRLQLPVPKGEVALSYHNRKTIYEVSDEIISATESTENRLGFDARFDMAVGWWIEGSWMNNTKNIGILTNQTITNIGIDYTFGIGSGLYVIYEQLFAAYSEKTFDLSNSTNFSMLSMSYPIGLFDNMSAIVYYNWETKSMYNFLSWQKQFDKITLHTIAYWNPENYQIPTQGSSQNLYGGIGIQVMFVFNH